MKQRGRVAKTVKDHSSSFKGVINNGDTCEGAASP
jgi:hypothetical protein